MGKQSKTASGATRTRDQASHAPANETPQVIKVGDEMEAEVTPERVRVRAYQIYLERNGAPGDSVSDWCQAEREILGSAAPGMECSGGDPSCGSLQREDPPEIHVMSRSGFSIVRTEF